MMTFVPLKPKAKTINVILMNGGVGDHIALCTKCYYRVKRGGTPEVSKKQQMALRKCSIENCGKPHNANDLCAMHNRRLQRHGDPNFINPKCNRDDNYKQCARGKTAQWKQGNQFCFHAFPSIPYIILSVDVENKTVSFKTFKNELVTRSFQFMQERTRKI